MIISIGSLFSCARDSIPDTETLPRHVVPSQHQSSCPWLFYKTFCWSSHCRFPAGDPEMEKWKYFYLHSWYSNWPGLTHRSQNRKGCCLSSCRSHCRCRTEGSRAWSNTPPSWQPWPDWWGWWRDWSPWPPWCPPASRCRCVWQDSRTGHSRWCFPEDHLGQDTRNIPEIQFINILPSWYWHQGAILYNKLIPLTPMKIRIKRKHIHSVSLISVR